MVPLGKNSFRGHINSDKKVNPMGDKSPKSNQKKASQKQSKANSANHKKTQANMDKQSANKKK